MLVDFSFVVFLAVCWSWPVTLRLQMVCLFVRLSLLQKKPINQALVSARALPSTIHRHEIWVEQRDASPFSLVVSSSAHCTWVSSLWLWGPRPSQSLSPLTVSLSRAFSSLAATFHSLFHLLTFFIFHFFIYLLSLYHSFFGCLCLLNFGAYTCSMQLMTSQEWGITKWKQPNWLLLRLFASAPFTSPHSPVCLFAFKL